MEGITFRWVDGPDMPGSAPASEEDWNRICTLIDQQGWSALNRALSRVLLAENDKDEIKGLCVMQLYPHAEPLWVDSSERGTGLADELATQMIQFLKDIKARGWLVIADSPFAEKLCQAQGMKRVESPVYRTVN